MGDDYLELSMVAYLNKDWVMEVSIEDGVEEVMTSQVFGE